MHRNRDCVTIEALKQAELDLILGSHRRRAVKHHPPTADTPVAEPDPDHPSQGEASPVPEPAPALWGISLSGGGIRSATFSLGVLQVLARNDLLRCFHYQSTVSGGGYIGAFLQGLIRRQGYQRAFEVLKSSMRDRSSTSADPSSPPDDPQKPILHLRRYSNYLSPRKSALSGDTLGMLGTYVRNVLLIQLQLCALLLTLSLVPVVLYPWVKHVALHWPAAVLLGAGGLCVLSAFLLGRVTSRANRLRSAAIKKADSDGTPTAAPPSRSETSLREAAESVGTGLLWCASLAIVALALATVLGAVGLWGLNSRLGTVADGWFINSKWSDLWSSNDGHIFWIAGGFYLVAWILWVIIEVFAARFRSREQGAEEVASPLLTHVPRFMLATLVAAAFAGWAVVQMRHINGSWLGDAGLWHALIFGPTCVLIVLTLTGILHLGLAGPALSDLQREVWARVGGRAAAVVVLGMTVSFAFTIYGPWLTMHALSFAHGRWHVTGWAGVLTWAITSGAGVVAAYSSRRGDAKRRSRTLDMLARVAPWVFLFGLLVAISRAGLSLLALSGWDPLPPGSTAAPAYLDYLARESVLHWPIALAVLAGALFIWLLFGFALDLNEFSMNAFYRNRLVRCYLGASNPARAPEPITNFDPRDDIVLADVVEMVREDGVRPLFPLVGTTLNLVGGAQLDWQDRKAASFCLTPGYCGYIPPPSHPDDQPVGDADAATAGTARPKAQAETKPAMNDSIAATITLGSAITISGAAVSPNMGYHSSPAVTFLLTLFDARLGWWLLNPARKHTGPGNGVTFFGRWLVTEMLGRTRSTGEYVYLSDGGHFENLGVYELVRRGCRFILCVDAGADPDRDFADLGNATQKCRADFGVDIQIVTSDLQLDAAHLSSRSCAVGRILYPDGSPPGTLLYLKPSLTGVEPTDVAHYARAHPSFPHESTADQYFDEAQFESYRRLGETVASAALEPVLERVDARPPNVAHGALRLGDSALKELILVELEQYWVAPLSGVQQHFARHAASMSALFSRLRDDPRLAVLDAQIYPAWVDLVASVPRSEDEPEQTRYQRRTELPADEDFRACFYFCQELAQLMQAIYHDFDLEQEWNHPDNTGWMNAFRQWSWAAMFRVSWAVGAPTYGQPFVTFCELRLGLPRLVDAVHVEDVAAVKDVSWVDQCNALVNEGRINHVEQGILLSKQMPKLGPASELRVFLLRIHWKEILKRTSADLPDTTLGISVVHVVSKPHTPSSTLIVMRVQDHLRHMGLGSEFMRLLVAKQKITSAHIRPGHYGPVGVCSSRDAAALQERLTALLGRKVSDASSQRQAQKPRERKTHASVRPAR